MEMDQNTFGSPNPLPTSALFPIYYFLFTSFYEYLVHHSTNQLFNYFLLNHTPNPYQVPVQAGYLSDYRRSWLSLDLRPVKKLGANPFPWWDYTDLKYSPDFLSSTYGNHNHLAGYLEMATPLTLGLFLVGYRHGVVSILVYLSFLLLIALVLTLSRGGWMSALMGFAFMAFALLTSRYFQRKKLLMALIGGSLALALIVLASTPVVERVRTVMEKEEEASLYSRVLVWGGVMHMMGDHPLLGIGPGTFPIVFTQYQPPGFASRYFYAHNDYLHFTSEVGLPLIVIIIWMVIALYRKGFKKLKDPSRLVRGTTLGAMSGITAILFHSISDFNLHIPANALLFTVLVAIVVAPLPKQESAYRFQP